MRLALVALVVLVAGCGDVTTEQLGPEGGASEGGGGSDAAVAVQSDSRDGSVPEAPPAPPSCNVDERCAACAPYPCAAVIACALSGDAGAFPWQSCHNLNASPADVDGLHCAMRAACP